MGVTAAIRKIHRRQVGNRRCRRRIDGRGEGPAVDILDLKSADLQANPAQGAGSGGLSAAREPGVGARHEHLYDGLTAVSDNIGHRSRYLAVYRAADALVIVAVRALELLIQGVLVDDLEREGAVGLELGDLFRLPFLGVAIGKCRGDAPVTGEFRRAFAVGIFLFFRGLLWVFLFTFFFIVAAFEEAFDLLDHLVDGVADGLLNTGDDFLDLGADSAQAQDIGEEVDGGGHQIGECALDRVGGTADITHGNIGYAVDDRVDHAHDAGDLFLDPAVEIPGGEQGLNDGADWVEHGDDLRDRGDDDLLHEPFLDRADDHIP